MSDQVQDLLASAQFDASDALAVVRASLAQWTNDTVGMTIEAQENCPASKKQLDSPAEAVVADLRTHGLLSGT